MFTIFKCKIFNENNKKVTYDISCNVRRLQILSGAGFDCTNDSCAILVTCVDDLVTVFQEEEYSMNSLK